VAASHGVDLVGILASLALPLVRMENVMGDELNEAASARDA
jgi:hypothetical protein